MVYFSCIKIKQKEPVPEWLFNYENVVIYGRETLIFTDIDYDVATFGNKAWVFQFKCTELTSTGSTLALFGAGTTFFLGANNYGQTLIKQNRSDSNYTYISTSGVGSINKDISIEYDGNGTLKTYVNGTLDKTVTHFNPEYLTDAPSDATKIFLGAWRYEATQYLNFWNGTFAYIRMKFMAPPVYEYLFNYENLSIQSYSDSPVTNVLWHENTFGNNKWVLEFSIATTIPTTESCFMSMTETRDEWYIRNGKIMRWYNGSRGNDLNNTAIQTSDDVSLEYDGNGNISCYINNVLDNTLALDAHYSSGTSSNYIQVGSYQGSSALFNGTFNYIRMRLID